MCAAAVITSNRKWCLPFVLNTGELVVGPSDRPTQSNRLLFLCIFVLSGHISQVAKKNYRCLNRFYYLTNCMSHSFLVSPIAIWVHFVLKHGLAGANIPNSHVFLLFAISSFGCSDKNQLLSFSCSRKFI